LLSLIQKKNSEWYKIMALIPKTGAWVMIRQTIPVEYPIDPMSLYFAVPNGKLFWKNENHMSFMDQICSRDSDDPQELMRQLNMRWRDFDEFKMMIWAFYRMKNAEAEYDRKHLEQLEEWDRIGYIGEDVIEQQVKIKTPFGDVAIQPHEYTVVKELQGYIEPVKDGHAFMRFMSNQKQLTGKIADQVFYLRQRGIPFAEAIQLCIQNVKTQNLFYIEMHPEYQKMFTRDFDQYWAKKLAYCIEHKRQDLLNYGPHWDFSKYEFKPKRKPGGKGVRKSKRITDEESSDTGGNDGDNNAPVSPSGIPSRDF
jgi:hypothetical protein